jgi:GNAT superfamily N-acetyltransferase
MRSAPVSVAPFRLKGDRAVTPKHRGQGVARALLRGAVAYAEKHGATLIEAYPVDKPTRYVVRG